MRKQGEKLPKKQDHKGQSHHTKVKKSGESERSDKQYSDTFLINKTPFLPRMKEHADTLAGMKFAAQRRNFMRQLHQTYGSKYVQLLLASMNVQAQLTISHPNDTYEQEADSVADIVAKKLNSQAQRQLPEEEELLQGKPVEEDELLQGKPDVNRQVSAEKEEIQTQSSVTQVDKISKDIETHINSSRRGGQPLADNIKEPMEQAFGADFSGVRAHTDPEADILSEQLSARAFTIGEDVFFREGEFNPGTDGGKKLIAHELTHVVQQNAAPMTLNSIYENAHFITSDKRSDSVRKKRGDSDRIEVFLEEHPGYDYLFKDINDEMGDFDIVDTLLRNFLYRTDFKYNGLRFPLWSHEGDCFNLCSEFFIICRDCFKINFDPKQSLEPVFVPGPTKQIGDNRTGNADSGRAWIYDEHYWLAFNGNPIDVLFGHWGLGHFSGLTGKDENDCVYYRFAGVGKVYFFNRQAKDLSDVYTSNPAKKARDIREVPL